MSECKFLALDHCGTQALTAVMLGEKVCFESLATFYFSLFPPAPQGLATGEVGPWSYGTHPCGPQLWL